MNPFDNALNFILGLFGLGNEPAEQKTPKAGSNAYSMLDEQNKGDFQKEKADAIKKADQDKFGGLMFTSPEQEQIWSDYSIKNADTVGQTLTPEEEIEDNYQHATSLDKKRENIEENPWLSDYYNSDKGEALDKGTGTSLNPTVNPYYDESELSQSNKSDQGYFPLPSLGYNELSQEDLDIFNLENPFNLKGGLFNETYVNNPNQHNEFVATTTDPYLLASLPYMDYSNWGGMQGSNSLRAAEAREYWANNSSRATQEQKEKYPAEAQKARDEAEKSKEALQSWADSMQQDAINITEHNSIPFDPEAALEEYLNNGVAYNHYTPGTGYADLLDEQNMGSLGTDAKQSIAGTNQSPDAVIEQAAAENDYRPIGMETAIQGDLANAFRESLNGNEAARDYYTDVSSKIYDYYQDAFFMAKGYSAPYNNLFDFCMHCTPDEFWEYAQFTHSYFGMYTGPEFDNPDGTLNEQAIYDFYNNCKSIYTISRVLGMDEDVIGAFVSDYKTAQDLATYLISSGYASPNENFAQGLWAANVVGDATSQDPYRNKDQGKDTWQDAYNQLENTGVQVGGYESGGRFSDQGRLLENPYNDWTDENKYAIPYNILNDEDALSYLDDWQKIADTIAYSQGWGFDRGR
jgi:hypothetical protein